MFFFFFKQKTAYEMRISDGSSDLCSSDLHEAAFLLVEIEEVRLVWHAHQAAVVAVGPVVVIAGEARGAAALGQHGSVAKIVKLEHAWRRLDGRNDDGFQVAPFPG